MANMQKTFRAAASLAPEFNDNDRSKEQIDLLADKYCEALDSGDREQQGIYSAALILKFWTRIKDMYDKTRVVSDLEYEDFITVLYERINYACRYRRWQEVYPEGHKKAGQRITNAQSCINQSISTEIQNIFGRANWHKNKANNPAGMTSLDAPIGSEDDRTSLADTIASEEEDRSSYDVEAIINALISRNKVIEAIIFDIIAFGDCTKVTKKSKTFVNEDGEEEEITAETHEFWRHGFINAINDLPENYAQYFEGRYNISEPMLNAGLKKIRESNNSKLYKYLDAAKEIGRAVFASR